MGAAYGLTTARRDRAAADAGSEVHNDARKQANIDRTRIATGSLSTPGSKGVAWIAHRVEPWGFGFMVFRTNTDSGAVSTYDAAEERFRVSSRKPNTAPPPKIFRIRAELEKVVSGEA